MGAVSLEEPLLKASLRRDFCFPAIRQGYSRDALHQYSCRIAAWLFSRFKLNAACVNLCSMLIFPRGEFPYAEERLVLVAVGS